MCCPVAFGKFYFRGYHIIKAISIMTVPAYKMYMMILMMTF
jgi:hypothetical protein